MKINLDWLRDYVDIHEDPAAVAESLTMAGLEVEGVSEHEGVPIFEISVTANRPDWLCHLGVARELAAIFKRPLRMPDTSLREDGPPVEALTSFEIEDPKGCPRYSGRVVQGIRIGPSPAQVSQRLESVDVRSINNVVDATNYVMLELGQPLHAFDYHRLAENRIVVRLARPGETMETLDGQTRQLENTDLLICDGLGPVALAGVMGGLNSEVEQDTQDLLLESACFDPVTIRRTSKRLGLSTEASYRFERGTDPTGTVRAVDRLAKLVLQWAGGTAVNGALDVNPRPEPERTVSFRMSRINSFLSTRISANEARGILSRLEMTSRKEPDGTWSASVPGFRRDVSREEDIIEEVARIAGYDRVPVTMPQGLTVPVVRSPLERLTARTRDAMESMGFSDAITYAFVDPADLREMGLDGGPEPVTLLNPISEDMTVMRTSLLPGLLKSLRLNLNRRNEDVRLYEVGRVFLPCGHCELPEERMRVAAVMTGARSPKTWYRDGESADFFDVKGAAQGLLAALGMRDVSFAEIQTPWLQAGQSAWIMAGDRTVGPVGTLRPELREKYRVRGWAGCLEIDLSAIEDIAITPRYRPLPQFPAVLRDLAILAPREVSSLTIENTIRGAAEDLAVLRLFDLYQGKGIEPGQRSLAYSLVFQNAGRTLTDEEVDVSVANIVQALGKEHGAKLR